MKNLTRALLFILFVPLSAWAQERDPRRSPSTVASASPSPSVASVQQSRSGTIIRSGWRSPVYSSLRWVPDPRRAAVSQKEPELRASGYWQDMRGDSSGQNGVVLFYFVEGSTVFVKCHENDRAIAILEDTFYNTSLIARMEYVTITAAASPSGTTSDNEKLAANRALAIKQYMLEMFPYLDGDRIITYSAGEDWVGLKQMIEEDPFTPGRQEALRLLGAPLPVDMLRERLKMINRGETYRYISEHMFPLLRGGAACMIYFKQDVQESEPVSSQEWSQPHYQPHSQPQYQAYSQPQYQAYSQPQYQPWYHYQYRCPPACDSCSPAVAPSPRKKRVRPAGYSGIGWERDPVFDLKTNLLYDLTATVNLALEFPLWSKISLDIPVNYNGWKISAGRMWRHVLVQPELRWWTKHTAQGHFFGLHGIYSYYNIGGLPTSDYMQTHRFEGSMGGVGVSYGHRWNFRNPRWGIELTLGMGYTRIRYDEYLCKECGQDTPVGSEPVKKHWIGPTKLGVNLVYRVGGRRK